MTSPRCPSCGAALASGAQWCTLCYADLREKPAVAETAAPAPAPAPVAGGRHRHAPRHAAGAGRRSTNAATGMAADLLDPAFDRPVMTHSDAVQTLAADLPLAAPPQPGDDGVPSGLAGGPITAASWPCFVCGATVLLDQAVCPYCGSGFLAGAEPTPTVNLPGIGDVRTMSTGMRVALIAGGAIGLTIVLLTVLALLGRFF